MIKERPILFSSAMVRAILDGHKKQTRRVINPGKYLSCLDPEDDQEQLLKYCPYGQTGPHFMYQFRCGRKKAKR